MAGVAALLDRHLVVDRHNGDSETFFEATCCVCDKPIPWVLDMMSFQSVNGVLMAGHASCLWTKEAFTNQRKRAQK